MGGDLEGDCGDGPPKTFEVIDGTGSCLPNIFEK